MEIIEIHPHDKEPESTEGYTTVFLAGTIDMGNSEDWQHEFIEWAKSSWKSYEEKGYIFYNPRREKGFGDDAEEFNYQVNWELEHLEKSDNIVMNIIGTSKSPISLLELGLFGRTPGKMEVICEPDFYRYGNVKIVCEKYLIPLYNSMEDYKSCLN